MNKKDLTDMRTVLTKVMVEPALSVEFDEHLGYRKHEQSSSDNSCNGIMRKIVRTEDGQFELDTPRDRQGDFEPQLVKKHQTRFTSMDDKILFLYAQGMATREIVDTFKEMYGADVSASLISKVTARLLIRWLSGSHGHWMRFIPSFIWAASWLKSAKINT